MHQAATSRNRATTEANIEIFRNDKKLKSISIVMPTWLHHEDTFLSVQLPLLGTKTVANFNDENDVDEAIQEAIKLFCLSSENFGQGLELELQALGWNLTEEDESHASLCFSTNNSVFEQIMETGDQFASTELDFA